MTEEWQPYLEIVEEDIPWPSGSLPFDHVHHGEITEPSVRGHEHSELGCQLDVERIGETELVASAPGSYEQTAHRVAADDGLRDLRESDLDFVLAQQSSPVQATERREDFGIEVGRRMEPVPTQAALDRLALCVAEEEIDKG